MAKRPKYEGSAADRAEDRRGAKKRGMTQGQFEKTPQDRRQDRAGQKRLDKRRGR
jgi:hypothetical protein